MVSLFWLRRVSSMAFRTTAVCCTLCSLGDERILSSLSLRDISASAAILECIGVLGRLIAVSPGLGWLDFDIFLKVDLIDTRVLVT